MINGPPLEALTSFAALADELHFTRAAARLHVAQPALTKRIQQLERLLGVRLFVRTRRSVTLTSDGELLLEKARHVIRAAEDLAATARRLSDGELGTLRIGFTPSAPHHVLPALMRTFRRRHPAISCMLAEAGSEDQIRQILDGELDVGILRPPATRPAALVCTTFLEEPYVAVLPRSHRLASSRAVSLTDLSSDPFVLIARRVVAAIHDQIVAACVEAGFTAHVVQEATHIHAVVALVAAGCGVSVLPKSAAELGVRDVVCCPLTHTSLQTVMAVAHLRHRATPAVRAFVQSAVHVHDDRNEKKELK
jgi:DNA-binding transcriptional LysR family regulator